MESANRGRPATAAARHNGLGSYRLANPLANVPAWPADAIRRATEAEDALIFADPQAPAAPLDAADIDTAEEGRWLVASSISCDAALDGAAITHWRFVAGSP